MTLLEYSTCTSKNSFVQNRTAVNNVFSIKMAHPSTPDTVMMMETFDEDEGSIASVFSAETIEQEKKLPAKRDEVKELKRRFKGEELRVRMWGGFMIFIMAMTTFAATVVAYCVLTYSQRDSYKEAVSDNESSHLNNILILFVLMFLLALCSTINSHKYWGTRRKQTLWLFIKTSKSLGN